MLKVLKYVYRRNKLKLFLKTVSEISVLLFLGAFGALSVLSFLGSWVYGLKMLVFMAVPFLLVSVARKLFNTKRPYEVYDFYLEKPRSKKGESFPSRHVFSAFLIATLFYTFSLPVAIVLAAFGALLALSRVLLGIHFPSDVIAGAVIGILSGILGILLLSL